MNAFSNNDENILGSVPYPVLRDGNVETVYSDGFVSIEKVPSVFGSYTTVASGTGGARRGSIVLAYHTGDVLMIRQPRPALGLITWELPRGGANHGEYLENAAIRELKEETGIDIVSEQLVSLGKVFPDTGLINSDVEAFFVDASFGDKTPLRLGEDEQIAEGLWVPKDTLLDACMDGSVECGYTLMAVMRAFTRHLI